MTNILRSKKIIQALTASGVQRFLVCAGARNGALVKALSAIDNLDVKSFFDERSAGFFALGLCRKYEEPVVVVTTSGTAVAELFPAVIEAHYQNLPLIVLSADRPQSFRGSGAPQAIEQKNIFSNYTTSHWDIGENESLDKLEFNPGPAHINMCFAEPLIDEEIKPWGSLIQLREEVSFSVEPSIVKEKIESFFKCSSFPGLVVGPLSASEAEYALPILEKWQGPLYLEATSQLKTSLKSFNLKTWSSAFNKKADGVIRIGGVPTFKFWRELENSKTPVLSLSNTPFSGLARPSLGPLPLEASLEFLLSNKTLWAQEALSELIALNKNHEDEIENLLLKHPQSEPSMTRQLSQWVGSQDNVFLGNSLPIRYWDEFAQTQSQKFGCQRGANGIDGLVSNFLAFAGPQTSWLIVGDLSALYDLSALAATAHAETQNLKIVVMNNDGGQIFERMFSDPNFINSHGLNFSGWAQQFGWSYEVFESLEETPQLPEGPTIIEIKPSNESTAQFWANFDQL